MLITTFNVKLILFESCGCVEWKFLFTLDIMTNSNKNNNYQLYGGHQVFLHDEPHYWVQRTRRKLQTSFRAIEFTTASLLGIEAADIDIANVIGICN